MVKGYALVNGLGEVCPGSVVRITDHPDMNSAVNHRHRITDLLNMNSAVNHRRKVTNQTKQTKVPGAEQAGLYYLPGGY